MTRLRISNGRLLDPASKLDRTGDLCIEDGRIVAAGRRRPVSNPNARSTQAAAW